MTIHAIETGKVKITKNWRTGLGDGNKRLMNTLFDSEFTEWLPIYVWVIEHNGEGPGLGARYHQARKTDRQRYEMIHFERGISLSIKTIPGASPRFERHLRFEAVSNGTRLIDEMSLPTGYPGIVEGLFAGRVRRAVAENLGKLKELLEHGYTQLQDGRGVYLGADRWTAEMLSKTQQLSGSFPRSE